jgi:hypothetical protein
MAPREQSQTGRSRERLVSPDFRAAWVGHAAWEVEFTDEFEQWWHTFSESEQGKVDNRVSLLIERDPNLGFPFSSEVKTPRIPGMRDLRVQAGGRPVSDVAILLVAGDKTGDDRWYEINAIWKRSGKRGANMARNFRELRPGLSSGAKAVCQYARQLPSGRRRGSGDSRGVPRWSRCEDHAISLSSESSGICGNRRTAIHHCFNCDTIPS